MTCNVGTVDKIVRLVIAAVLLIIGHNIGSWTLNIIGCIPILTATFAYCPLYSVIKVSTCKTN